ncbi:MAG: FHA domain-containing protein [Planctomycetota bacterium]
MYGELVPLGGGDPIPLLKKQLLVGRRESCDIVLRFANVSAHHCTLYLNAGYWFVRDMQSRNGVKVNNVKVQEKRLDPGDQIAIAKHRYEVEYVPSELGAVGPPPMEDRSAEILGESLLSRAGLQSSDPGVSGGRDKRSERTQGRYDVLDNDAGQIKLPDKPV